MGEATSSRQDLTNTLAIQYHDGLMGPLRLVHAQTSLQSYFPVPSELNPASALLIPSPVTGSSSFMFPPPPPFFDFRPSHVTTRYIEPTVPMTAMYVCSDQNFPMLNKTFEKLEMVYLGAIAYGLLTTFSSVSVIDARLTAM